MRGLFHGAFEGSLDARAYGTVPAHLRELLGGSRLWIAPVYEYYLMLLPEMQKPRSNRIYRIESRLWRQSDYLCDSWPVLTACDARGRIYLPAHLCRCAHLGRRVIWIGVLDHIELWDRERWRVLSSCSTIDHDEYLRQFRELFPDLSDALE